MKKLVASLLVTVLFISVASISTAASEQAFGKVDTEGSNLNVRTGPGTNYSIMTRMSDGTYFKILDEQNGWYQITAPSITSGWVSGDYVKTISALKMGQVDTEGSRLNLRSGPNTSYTSLSLLTDGSYFEILSDENGWVYVDTGSMKGYLSKPYIKTFESTGGAAPSNNQGYLWPLEGDSVITQNYSASHPATDISYYGTSLSQLGGNTRSVFASNDGVVEYVYTGCTHHKQTYICCNSNTGYGGGGNVIVIKHADGNYTMYAHLDEGQVFVKKGDTVTRGQVIGKAGNTGVCSGATGIHLHFEYRVGVNAQAYAVNALNYVQPNS